MNTNKQIAAVIAVIVVVLALSFIIPSRSARQTRDEEYRLNHPSLPVSLNSSKNDTVRILRIKVLENQTISYINIQDALSSVYKPLDTVWVNLNLHQIDDTDTSAMKAVILAY